MQNNFHKKYFSWNIYGAIKINTGCNCKLKLTSSFKIRTDSHANEKRRQAILLSTSDYCKVKRSIKRNQKISLCKRFPIEWKLERFTTVVFRRLCHCFVLSQWVTISKWETKVSQCPPLRFYQVGLQYYDLWKICNHSESGCVQREQNT